MSQRMIDETGKYNPSETLYDMSIRLLQEQIDFLQRENEALLARLRQIERLTDVPISKVV